MKLSRFNPKRGPNVISAEGILKLLNDGSNIESLLVMLREAVQNSWDARKSNEHGINFTVRGFRLDQENLSMLQKILGDDDYEWRLFKSIKANNTVFEVTDTGTKGLTGPTGFYSKKFTEQERYLKFIYEIGNAQDKRGAGGSFGYGKSSFYKTSKVGTTAVLTKIKNSSGQYEHRFIIKCVDKIGGIGSQNPGVFWWGSEIKRPHDIDFSPWVEPVYDEIAVEYWKQLGGTCFDDDETGTKIMVFSPLLIQDDDKLPFFNDEDWNLKLMARAMVHYFWAKWPDDRGKGGITFKIINDFNDTTEKMKIDKPAEVYPYKHFLNCLAVTKRQKDDQISKSHHFFKIKSGNPSEYLGNLVLAELNSNEIDAKYIKYFRNEDAYIALMRNVEFVVDYHCPSIGARLIDEGESHKKIFGVFRSLDQHKVKRFNGDNDPVDLNEVYRTAENQTHGLWSAPNVEEMGPWCKTYIRITYRRIESYTKQLAKTLSPKEEKQNVSAQAEFMGFLGQFIDGAQGGGQPVMPSTSNSNGNGKKSNEDDSEKLEADLDILSVERKQNGEGKFLEVGCKLRTNKPEEKIKISPICSDEEGNFSVKNDRRFNISLPVRIVEARSKGNNDKGLVVDDIGDLIVIPGSKEIDLSLQLYVIGECRFILKVN